MPDCFDPDEYDRELERIDRLNDHAPPDPDVWARAQENALEAALDLPAARRAELAAGPWRVPGVGIVDDLNAGLAAAARQRADDVRRQRRRRRRVDVAVALLAFALFAYIAYQGAGGPAWPRP